jgi:hypothetical protein
LKKKKRRGKKKKGIGVMRGDPKIPRVVKKCI